MQTIDNTAYFRELVARTKERDALWYAPAVDPQFASVAAGVTIAFRYGDYSAIKMALPARVGSCGFLANNAVFSKLP